MIPVNPSAIGDPNQTPVVYIGDAGKALGIPERAAQRPDGQVDLDEVRRRYAEFCVAYDADGAMRDAWPAIQSAEDVPALLADLDAAREALRRAEESIGAWTRAADRAGDECQRLQGLVEDARAERDRMRPVVEAVGVWANPDAVWAGDIRETPQDLALLAAWDIYETQEGTE